MTHPDHLHINFLDRKNRIADISYHPHHSYPAHRDEVSRISIVISGELKEKVGSKEIYAQTASLVVKPDTVIHKNDFGPKGARLISLIVEDRYIESLFPKHYSPWRWYQGLPYSRSICNFLYELKNQPNKQELEESMVEMFSVLLEQKLDPVKLKPDWLDRVREKIEDEYMYPGTGLQILADEAGVHPIYLARVFRKYHHCSVKDYVQNLRLQNALHQLASSKEIIAQIAYQEGFSDQSHLSRYFKSAFGLSPARFRKFMQNFDL
ncbi:MAG: AraC family transcriptional regulator [Bacteroidota bacterium]